MEGGASRVTGSFKLPWRRWLRALHRDVGYLAIGLTLVYAFSGIAVNHIADWDPNFKQMKNTSHLDEASIARFSALSLSEENSMEAAATLMKHLGRREPVEDAYAISPRQLEITLKDSTLFFDADGGTVLEKGQKERFLLRAANWLHLNRGKKSWTWIADGYAVFLLFLATSGLFMLPGRRGIIGRGGLLAFLGAAVPVAYVALSGGP
jgi:hypothetical protein